MKKTLIIFLVVLSACNEKEPPEARGESLIRLSDECRALGMVDKIVQRNSDLKAIGVSCVTRY